MYRSAVEWYDDVMEESMEKLAYTFLGVALICWILAALEIVPAGGLAALTGALGVALLMIKVIVERLRNKEDDHYSRVVKK